jgi:hypothetical protein
MFYVCSVTFLMLRGLRRLLRRNASALVPYLVLIGIFPITYYLSLALMDYREPIEPAVVVLAVAGAIPYRKLAGGLRRETGESADESAVLTRKDGVLTSR